MEIVHYLDTARLGLMSPTARDRQKELAEFASANAASIQMDRLIHDGGAAWDSSLRGQYPRLAGFPGIERFRSRMAQALNCDANQSLLFCTTSATPTAAIARLIFGPCNRLMTTDLSWPPFREYLQTVAERYSREVVVVPIRRKVQKQNIDETELRGFLVDQYRDCRCDGLYLTAVSHDGIRLPAAKIVDSVRDRHSLAFSVIDGSQEFGQVDHALSVAASDFFITSAHKWLGAYLPLTIGVYGRAGSKSRIEHIVSRLIETGEIDDPLLRLTWPSDSERSIASPSTANVASLITCDAAINDREKLSSDSELTDEAYESFLDQMEGLKWNARPVAAEFRSRTLMLQHTTRNVANDLRERLALVGLAVSAYDSGMVRLSIPRRGWSDAVASDVACRMQSA